MSCNNCNQSDPLTTYNIDSLSNCEDCNGGCAGGCTNTDCVYYLGPSLVCSTIDSGDTLSVALQKIDEKLCSTVGAFGVYDFSCLDDLGSITSQQQFVETISEYVCTLRSDFETFTDTTFVTYQDTVDDRFLAIENPAITCASASVVNTDTLTQVLNKYCTAITSIKASIDMSSVDWDQCISVNPDPTTVAEGFDVLIDQICDIRTIANSAASLPTFNNTTSCLASPGASDTLVTTINKIKDRLCLTPTLDNDNLTSSCITIPSSDLDLEGTLQAILDKLDDLSAANPTFDSGDFSVTATDGGDPCQGVTVALATPSDQDRFVAVDNTDSSPGTLSTKLTAGTNISLDIVTTPGTMIINSTGSTDTKVKAFSADPNAAGYLIDKLAGSSIGGLSLDPSSNMSTGKVDLALGIDWGTFVRTMMAAVNADPILKAEVCAFIASCGCNCGADDCTTYLITNNSEATVAVTYTSCIEGTEQGFNLPDGSSIEVCARTGTVSAPGCTVANVGDCAGGTTTTTTTTTTIPPETGSGNINFVNTSTGTSSITSFLPDTSWTFFAPGLFPVGTTETASGTYNAYSGSLLVDATVDVDSRVEIYLNGGLYLCQGQVGTGSQSYSFPAVVFNGTDFIEIKLIPGDTCP